MSTSLGRRNIALRQEFSIEGDGLQNLHQDKPIDEPN